MGMHIDATGQRQQPTGVVHIDICAGGDAFSYRFDAAIGYQYIGGVIIDRRNNTTIFDKRRSHLFLLH
jgi:hypothetical protein